MQIQLSDDLNATIRGMKIIISHEDGRKLGTIDADTGRCHDARQGEGASSWLSGCNLSVADVIAIAGTAAAIGARRVRA